MSRWERLSAAYDELLGLDSAGRELRLAELHRSDPDLSKELRQLLSAGSAEHGPVERAVEQVAEGLLPEQPAASDPVGARVGEYTLLEQIGQGGMGVVYRARRSDGNFDREVAVKFLSDGGWRTSRKESFLLERRILASLDHPNIARLIDASADETLGPYVIMELVEGEPIDLYCDRRNLGVRQRLQLFRKVCHAVQSAHQQLVVHRDIKPSNILVTADGEPKLLDFGIAKLLDEQPDTASDKTSTRVMTLRFASPEQIEGRGITTATDVYALGLVLYRLLTGRAPHSTSEDSSPFEHQRAVLETDAVSIAKAAAEAGRERDWVRSLRGDIDNIVAKSLQRNPMDRYGTAAQLAEELARHLEGLPVEARAASTGYRLGKFLRRNVVGVAIVAGLILTLSAAAVTTWRQARIAQTAQQEAELRNDELQSLTETILFDFHEELRQIPGTTEVRTSMVERASDYLESFRQRAADDPELAATVATAYERLGDLRGNPGADNTGDRVGAERTFLDGVEFCAQLKELPERSADLAFGCLRLRKRHGFMLYTNGRLDDSTAVFEEVIPENRRLVDRYPDDFKFHENLADSLSTLGEIHTWNGRAEEGMAMLRDAIDAYEALLPWGEKAYEVSKGLASAKTALAAELTYRKRFEEGFGFHREAVALARKEYEEGRDIRGRARNYWYQLVSFTNSLIDSPGDTAEVVAVAEETLALARRLREEDPDSDMSRNDLATSVRYFARAMVRAERPAEAVPAFVEAIDLYRVDVEHSEKLRRRVALASQGLAEAYRDLGRRQEACSRFAEALQIWKSLEANGTLQPVDTDWPRLVDDAMTEARCGD